MKDQKHLSSNCERFILIEIVLLRTVDVAENERPTKLLCPERRMFFRIQSTKVTSVQTYVCPDSIDRTV